MIRALPDAATYHFYADGTSASAVGEAAVAAALRLAPSALHVGTLGLVLEPLATATKALVDGVNGDALVLLDPNCRPTVTIDRGRYLETLAHCARRADVIKVSDEDLAFLVPGGESVQATRSLLRPGAVGLVTGGGDAVTIVTAGLTVVVAVPQVTVVDTVGAGDGFGGAFLALRSGTSHRGSPLRRAGRSDDLRTQAPIPRDAQRSRRASRSSRQCGIHPRRARTRPCPRSA